ncbi:hypothetical protein [Roseomonas elaeocarpi]|uniref:Uncharacterized protein n=1 Tax=Roseomonas elaeocarpi TaxID=907779 RepID=A0ABV6JQD8_9PROT
MGSDFFAFLRRWLIGSPADELLYRHAELNSLTEKAKRIRDRIAKTERRIAQLTGHGV